jgi:hypothetical protein
MQLVVVETSCRLSAQLTQSSSTCLRPVVSTFRGMVHPRLTKGLALNSGQLRFESVPVSQFCASAFGGLQQSRSRIGGLVLDLLVQEEAIMSVRLSVPGQFDRDEAPVTIETFEALSSDLAAVVAVTPVPDRQHALEMIGRVICDQVRVIDRDARDQTRRFQAESHAPVGAPVRRASRKTRPAVENLEGRTVPSVMTITVTNVSTVLGQTPTLTSPT